MNFITIIVIPYSSCFPSFHFCPPQRNNDTPIKTIVCFTSVDLKRKKCFSPNIKETVTGTFEMREIASCAEAVREEKRRIRSLCNLPLAVLIIIPKLHSLLYDIETYKRKISDLVTPAPA
jgi:hypothetical protein